MLDFTAPTPRAALRASLETLRAQFNDGATKYPWFQHVLATGPIDHTDFPCIDRHIIPEHLAIQDSFDVTTTDCTPQLFHETMDRWDDRCFAGLVTWYWCRRAHIGQKVVDPQERIECAKCAQLFEPLARQTARLLLESGFEGGVSEWRQRDSGGHKYWLWFLHKTLKPEPIVVGRYQFSLINNLFLASALTIDTMLALAEGTGKDERGGNTPSPPASREELTAILAKARAKLETERGGRRAKTPPAGSRRSRYAEQSLRAFSLALARHGNTRLRIYAVGSKYVRDDGQVAVPRAMIPAGGPKNFYIGADSRALFQPQHVSFHGLGSGAFARQSGVVERVGFFLYGPASGDVEVVKTFRRRASDAGAIVLADGLVDGIQTVHDPTAFWTLVVFSHLMGTAWVSETAIDDHDSAFVFHPFGASVEAWRLILAQRDLEKKSPTARHKASADVLPRSDAIAELETRLSTILKKWQEIEGEIGEDVLGAAERFYYDEFCPWAADVVRTFGLTPFSPDPGDPPAISRDTLTLNPCQNVTGTPNTIAGGKRVIFWSAAHHKPSLCERTEPSYLPTVQAWASKWLVYQKEHDPGWRTFHQGLNWVRDAFKELAALANDDYFAGTPAPVQLAKQESPERSAREAGAALPPESPPAFHRSSYLGLLFYDARRTVEREGVAGSVDLSRSQLNWAILKKLAENHDVPLCDDAIRAVWENHGVAKRPSDGTVHDAVSALRAAIRPLGLTIETRRGLGRLLTHLPAEKTLPPKTARRRKNNRRVR